MFVEREQIMNYLIQACDAKNKTIEELKKKIAELEGKASTEQAVKIVS